MKDSLTNIFVQIITFEIFPFLNNLFWFFVSISFDDRKNTAEVGYLTSLEFLKLIEKNLVDTIPMQTFCFLTSLNILAMYFSIHFVIIFWNSKTQNEQFSSISNFPIESAEISNYNFVSGDVPSLCDAWENKNIKALHVDSDEINCLCCSCCPFDSWVLRVDYTKW